MTQLNITISSVEIPVVDLQRAAGWYERALGYICEWSDSHHALLVQQTNVASPRILLVVTRDTTRLGFQSAQAGLDHAVIDFETDNLDSFHAHLSTQLPDLESIPEPANDWAPRGFSFYDSEGNRLAVFSY